MKNLIICLCTLLATASASAQGQKVSYWEDTPPAYKVPDVHEGESAVIIEENSRIRYAEGEDRKSYMQVTIHRVVKVLDEIGVEGFNNLSFPIYSIPELEQVKARTILPDGKVINVAADQIKEAKGEDGSKEVAFAMEGVAKNAIVEFLIIYRKPVLYFGREAFQLSVPVLHATLEIRSPASLQIEQKGYNGFPTVKDTLIADTRYIFAEQYNIPPLQRDETYSFPDRCSSRAEYKVSYLPEEKGNVRVFTWQGMVNKLYSGAYDVSDKESKAVRKYLSSIGVTDKDSEEAKIIKIESAIKGSVTMYKQIEDDNAWKLDNVISKKAATEGSLVRLFAACFAEAEVKHEFGIAPDRSVRQLDEEFENWGSVENYLFYFPNQKKYLSPASVYYRYPFTSTDVIGEKALFCKLATLGNVTSALTDIRVVTPEPATRSEMNIAATISFDNEMEATADVAYGFLGYSAMGMREYAVLLPKDKLKELVQTVVGIAERPEDLLQYTITGEAFDNYQTSTPMVINATVKTPRLVEKAGEKYIFRVGDVIGRQTELYQTAERKHPIDITYPHYLKRTIDIRIPKGYKILNPEGIKMSVDHKDDKGVADCGFYSDYKIENDKLSVTITEFYARLHYPATDYEQFRKVINAAADFNKVTLLLGK